VRRAKQGEQQVAALFSFAIFPTDVSVCVRNSRCHVTVQLLEQIATGAMSPFNFFANFGISNYRAGARKMTQNN
jgi:hypothetical protein